MVWLVFNDEIIHQNHLCSRKHIVHCWNIICADQLYAFSGRMLKYVEKLLNKYKFASISISAYSINQFYQNRTRKYI